jgi:hypothetical protein
VGHDRVCQSEKYIETIAGRLQTLGTNSANAFGNASGSVVADSMHSGNRADEPQGRTLQTNNATDNRGAGLRLPLTQGLGFGRVVGHRKLPKFRINVVRQLSWGSLASSVAFQALRGCSGRVLHDHSNTEYVADLRTESSLSQLDAA